MNCIFTSALPQQPVLRELALSLKCIEEFRCFLSCINGCSLISIAVVFNRYVIVMCLCVFVHSGLQHILCCVFSIVLLRLVYPMLPVSLDCPFLIVPSVFSNVYSSTVYILRDTVLWNIYDNNVICIVNTCNDTGYYCWNTWNNSWTS